MNLSKHLSFAKNFAFDAKRVGVFFAFYAVALLAFGALALGFLAAIGGSFGLLARGVLFGGTQSLPRLLGFGLIFLFAFVILAIVFFLAYSWLFAGVTRKAAHLLRGKRVSLGACLSEGLACLPALIVLTVLIGLLSWVVTVIAQFVLIGLFVIPVAGPLLYAFLVFCVSLVVGLAFLFAQFFLLVKDVGVIEAARASVRLFARKPGGVFLAFLAYLVVSLGVIIVSALPLVATFLLALASFATLASKISLFAVLGIISLAILLLGISFLVVFNTGFFSSALMELTGEHEARIAARTRKKRR